MKDQFDLFEWADSRPTALVIDAGKLFRKRATNFIRLLALGYQFKTSGGAEPIKLDERRQERLARSTKVAPSSARAAG